MHSDNSQHLVDAARRRRADTFERARRVMRELGEPRQRHTVTQIAAHGGVSRSWLYAQPELRDQIRRLTTAPANSNAPAEHIERGSDASLRQRLTLAHERIRNQIAHLHGQLRRPYRHHPRHGHRPRHKRRAHTTK